MNTTTEAEAIRLANELTEESRRAAGHVPESPQRSPMAPRQPTPEECEARARVEHAGRKGFATWYPQMGGYVGRCVVLLGASTTVDGKDGGCFDVFVWHDGEFPFDGAPAELHHCMAEQFVQFGQDVLAHQAGAR